MNRHLLDPKRRSRRVRLLKHDDPHSLFLSEALERRTLLTAVNVLSYHNDAASTGQNLSETALTSANVNQTTFGKLYSTPVDGQVYAQPLYMTAVNITGGAHQGVHNVSYVVTEHDSLYAIDADTGVILWQDSFLLPSPALAAGGHAVTVSTVSNGDVNTSDISPEIGITSTPAIDPANGFLYLTAKTKQIVDGVTTSPHYVYNLYKVDTAGGAFTTTVIGDTTFSAGAYTYNSGPSILDSVTGPGAMGAGKVAVPGTNPQQWLVNFNTLRQMNRAAVTLYNGNVYLAFASHGDNNPYHGWILGYNESTLAPTAVFNAAPDGDATSNSSRDGIWMAGGKIAIDSGGFMYVMTGNGTFDTTLDANGFPINGDYGDSFIKLQVDPSTAANPNINGWGLKVVDYFTPYNQASLSSADQDLGSGGPIILPDSAGGITIGSDAHPHLLLGAGKEGLIYVIDRDNMGKFDPATDNVVQTFNILGGGGSYDTPAFFYDGTTARIYYVPVSTTAKSYTISNATIAPGSVSSDVYGSRCATTSISANGTANGIAWNIDPGTGQLRAYNASNYAQELWTSAQANGRDTLGVALKFTTPTVTNGRVYVGTSNALVVYGLFSPPTTAPTAPGNLTATPVSGVQINLSWQDNSNNEAGFYIEDSTDGTNFTRVGTANVNAASFLVSGLTPATSYTFRVQAFNVIGSSTSTNNAAATTLSPPPAVNFSSGFSGAGTSLQINGGASKIVNANLQLTDGAGNEAGSAFYTTLVSVARFTSTFTLQQSGIADGMTFTIQRAGVTAIGAAGSSLGYGPTPGIPKSVALKFDIFSNAGEGTDSTGVFTNGANPSVTTGSFDMTSSGVLLRSGDVMLVSLNYDGATLSESVTDTSTGAAYTRNYAVNIPSVVGASTAYVGFTGATGGSASTQSVFSWSFTPLPNPPVAPSNLAVTPASGTELDLSWTQTSGPVDHFNVFRLTAPNTYTQIAQVPGNITTYPDGGLAQNTTYSYEIVAVNAGGSSPVAGPFSGTTPVAPVAPDNLIAFNVTATGVTLTWRDNAANEDGYKIARQLESDNSIQLSPLPSNTSQFVDTNLIPGSVYSYTVDAYNIAGPSNGVNVVIITLPAAPTALSAVGQSGGVQLAWTAPKGAASYDVYRGASPGAESATPIATGVFASTFTDTNLPAGVTYYYKVTAVDPTGEGAQSTEASGIVSTTVINAPAAAPAISLVLDPDHLHVDWALGATGGQLLVTEPAGLTINSANPNQLITFDYTGGNPLPSNLHLNGTFTLNGLSPTNPLAGANLEIGQSTVYVSYSGASPASTLQQYLANGYNAGGWNGTPTTTTGVITSSAAASGPAITFGIGYADSADGAVSGQPANTIEIRYTVMGDSNLDRVVDSNDAITMARNYLLAGKTAWDQGNFNYDVTINLSDAQILQKNFNAVATVSAAPATSSGSWVPTTPTPGIAIPSSNLTPTGSTSTETTLPADKKKHRAPKSIQLVAGTKTPSHNR
jgi:hypothetical protein